MGASVPRSSLRSVEAYPNRALPHAGQLAQQGFDELLAAAAQRCQLLKGQQPQLPCLCSLTCLYSLHCQPLQVPRSLCHGSVILNVPALVNL